MAVNPEELFGGAPVAPDLSGLGRARSPLERYRDLMAGAPVAPAAPMAGLEAFARQTPQAVPQPPTPAAPVSSQPPLPMPGGAPADPMDVLRARYRAMRPQNVGVAGTAPARATPAAVVAPEPEPEPERVLGGTGVLGGLADVARGAVHGAATLPGMFGQATQFTERVLGGTGETGAALGQQGERFDAAFPGLLESERGQAREDPLSPRGQAYESGESTIQSLALPLAGAAIGGAVGGPIGAAIGGIGGLAAQIWGFAGQQGEESYQNVLKAQREQKVPEAQAQDNAMRAGLINAGFEAGGEALGSVVTLGAARLLPRNVRQGIIGAVTRRLGLGADEGGGELIASVASNRGAYWRAVKDVAGKVIPTELATEMGQAVGQQATEAYYGAAEAPTLNTALQVVIPTMVMAGFSGAGVHAYAGIQRARVNRLLSNPDDGTPEGMAERARAAAAVEQAVRQEDVELADIWHRYAVAAVGENRPMVIDEDRFYRDLVAGRVRPGGEGRADVGGQSRETGGDAAPTGGGAATTESATGAGGAAAGAAGAPINTGGEAGTAPVVERPELGPTAEGAAAREGAPRVQDPVWNAAPVVEGRDHFGGTWVRERTRSDDGAWVLERVIDPDGFMRREQVVPAAEAAEAMALTEGPPKPAEPQQAPAGDEIEQIQTKAARSYLRALESGKGPKRLLASPELAHLKGLAEPPATVEAVRTALGDFYKQQQQGGTGDAVSMPGGPGADTGASAPVAAAAGGGAGAAEPAAPAGATPEVTGAREEVDAAVQQVTGQPAGATAETAAPAAGMAAGEPGGAAGGAGAATGVAGAGVRPPAAEAPVGVRGTDDAQAGERVTADMSVQAPDMSVQAPDMSVQAPQEAAQEQAVASDKASDKSDKVSGGAAGPGVERGQRWETTFEHEGKTRGARVVVESVEGDRVIARRLQYLDRKGEWKQDGDGKRITRPLDAFLTEYQRRPLKRIQDEPKQAPTGAQEAAPAAETAATAPEAAPETPQVTAEQEEQEPKAKNPRAKKDPELEAANAGLGYGVEIRKREKNSGYDIYKDGEATRHIALTLDGARQWAAVYVDAERQAEERAKRLKAAAEKAAQTETAQPEVTTNAETVRDDQGPVRGEGEAGQPAVQPVSDEGGAGGEQPTAQGGQAADAVAPGAVEAAESPADEQTEKERLNVVRARSFPADWEGQLIRARVAATALIDAGLVNPGMQDRMRKRWNDVEDLTDSIKAVIAEIEGQEQAPVVAQDQAQQTAEREAAQEAERRATQRRIFEGVLADTAVSNAALQVVRDGDWHRDGLRADLKRAAKREAGAEMGRIAQEEMDPDAKADLMRAAGDIALSADVLAAWENEAVRRAVKADRAARKAEHQQTIAAAVAAAWSRSGHAVGADSEMDARWREQFALGWNHALEGGTGSNLTAGETRLNTNLRRLGYDAAVAWLGTEDGQAFATGKRGKKMEGVGTPLRRAQDERTRKLDAIDIDKNEEADAFVAAVLAETRRADLFPIEIPDDATPGTPRYLVALRNQLLPFQEWMAKNGYGGHKRYYRSPEETMRLIARQSREQREAIRAHARWYSEQMTGIAQVMQGHKTVAEAAAALTGWYHRDPASVTSGMTPEATVLTHGQAVDGGRRFSGLMRQGRIGILNRYLTPMDENYGQGYETRKHQSNEQKRDQIKRAQPLTRPRFDRVEREGRPDYRKGRNIDAAELTSAFGLKGVTYGESVTAKQRQDHTNYAYDAFMDLADVLGIDPKYIGMGGKITFAFGALGRGKAGAHYEPDHSGQGQAINLTNTRGDGAVAHEWFHALDYNLREQAARGGKEGQQGPIKDMISVLRYQVPSEEGIEKELQRFLSGTVKWQGGVKRGEGAVGHARYYLERTIRDLQAVAERGSSIDRWAGTTTTRYHREAQELGKDYWGNPTEEFARAGEAYVFDTLEGENNYLVSDWVEDGKVTAPEFRGRPYPFGDERQAFNEAFKSLFEQIEWTDAGPQSKGGDGRITIRDASGREIVSVQGRDTADAWIQANPGTYSLHPFPRQWDDSPLRLKARDGIAIARKLLGDLDERAAAEKQRQADEAAKAEAQQAEREAETKARQEAEEAGRAKKLQEEWEALQQQKTPSPDENGALSDDELSDLFDEVAAEEQEAAQEPSRDPEPAPTPEPGPETAPAFVDDPNAGVVSLARTIAQKMTERDLASKPLNWRELFKWADAAFGGTQAEGRYSPKDAYDAVEMALNLLVLDGQSDANRHAQQVVRASRMPFARIGLNGLDGLDSAIPTQTRRTAEQDEFQQFSTPHTHAAVMARVASLNADDVVLEPSAGSGNLATLARIGGPGGAVPQAVVVNELAPRRAAILRALGFEGVTTENAEHLHSILGARGLRPTVVIMNPPFSASAGRVQGKRDNRIGAKHIEEALKLMAPGGRLVALMGQGYTRGHARLKDHWGRVLKGYNVRANIGLSGEAYRKFGTTFDNRLVVIDKTGPTLAPDSILGGEGLTVAQALELLEGIRNDRVHVGEHYGAGEGLQPGGAEIAEAGRVAGGGGASVGGAGALGAGEPGAVGTLGEGARDDGGGAAGDLAGGAQGPESGGAAAGVRRGGRPGVLAGSARPGNRGRGAGVAGEPVLDQPGGAADRGLAAIAADAAKHGVEGISESLSGLAALFGAGRIQSFPSGFDAETYAKARPHFEKAGQAFLAAGQDIKAFFRFLIRNFGTGIKPYAIQYVKEYQKALAAAATEPAGNAPSPETVEDQTPANEPPLPAAEPEGAPDELTDSIYDRYAADSAWKGLGAQPHPGELVESAAMGAVRAPALTVRPSFPPEVYREGRLSEAQLDVVAYAQQAHEQMLGDGKTRRGFFIGDGTGVGKGREISGIIYNNQLQGRDKAVWISANTQLAKDSREYLTAVAGSDLGLFELGKVNADSRIESDKGVLFLTYDVLRSAGQGVKDETGKKVTEGKKRIDQIVEWLGEDFDGVIAFDEAHLMGNAIEMKAARGKKKPSQRALMGVALQERLPNARVVYASATGATEVSNLGYATRLGIYGQGTPFSDVKSFVVKVTEGGVAAMEVVAKDLKALGAYQARSLSYDDVTYDQMEHALTADQRAMYNEVAEAWQMVLADVNAALGEDETNAGKDGQAKGAALSAFWGAQQRFFNQMLTAIQMPSVIRALEADLAAGRSPVLQVVNTNEAATERDAARIAAEGRELEELDITPRQTLMQYLQNSFPVNQYETYTDENGNEAVRLVVDSQGKPVENAEAVASRDEMLDRLAMMRFPDSPLEILLNHFGADRVAEITGRKRRFVRVRDPATETTTMVEQRRSGPVLEKEAAEFQSGKRDMLLFSDAGGTGLSYHADLTKRNQKKRVHYLLQSGWRADKAIQGLGRTHRTNQAQAPHVVLVTTDLRGHRRFVASIARRMDQLGALTKGQRQTGGQGIFTPDMNLESEYSGRALEILIQDVMRGAAEGIDRAVLEKKMGLQIQTREGNRRTGGAPTIQQFLNRILVLDVEMQTRVFDAFFQRLQQQLEAARQAGTLDVGMENLQAKAVRKESEQVVYTHPETGAETRLVTLDLTHDVDKQTMDRVLAERAATPNPVLFFARNRKSGRVYAFSKTWDHTDKDGRVIQQYRRTPIRADGVIAVRVEDIGNPANPNHWVTREASKRWEYLDMPQAAEAWAKEYAETPSEAHQTVHLLTGVLLPIWDRLGNLPSLRIKRGLTVDGEVVLGLQVPDKSIDALQKRLTGTSRAAKLTPAEVFERVLKDGATVVLANDWRLVRRRVSDENRIELTGPYEFADVRLLQQQGVVMERIGFKARYFIPTGETGPAVLAQVMQNRPAAEILGVGEEDATEEARFARTPVVSPSGRVRAGDVPAGLSVAEVQGVVDRFGSRLLGAAAGRIPVQVFATQDEAFGPGSIDRYGRIKGAYLPATGRIVLIGAHLRNTRDAETVLRHEAVGHFGLNLLSPADKRAFLELVAEASGRSRYLRRVRDEVLRSEGADADPLLVAEEVFARVAESGRSNLGAAWDSLLMWLRDKLRELGLLPGSVGPVEMRAFAADIARGIRAGKAQRTFPATDQAQFSGMDAQARFMFAGERAETADRLSLDAARSRLDAGEDAERVRRSTGWFQGDDGKWRFEIDDSRARLTADFAQYRGIPAGMADVLQHPRLFAAYPALREVGVFIEIDESYAPPEGSYDPGRGIVVVKAPLPKDALSVLLHEVQHAVQTVEGFARGGAPGQGADAPFVYEGERVSALRDEQRAVQALLERELFLDQARDDVNPRFKELQRREAELEALLERAAAFEGYRRLAGEVEARNTANRQRLTARERAAYGPDVWRDVPADQVIVRFNGEDALSAPSPENIGGNQGARFRLADTYAGGRIRRSVRALMAAAEGQAHWRDWYDQHQAQIADLFGEDAGLFLDLLAATSQASSVAVNVALAIKAYRQWFSGLSFEGYLPAVARNLERLRVEQRAAGQKIAAFTGANQGAAEEIAVDRHIAQLLFNTTRPNRRQIGAAKRRIRTVAERLGWQPRQVQAALWAFNQERQGATPQSYASFLERKSGLIEALRAELGRGGAGGVSTGRDLGEGAVRGAGASAGAETGGQGALGEAAYQDPGIRFRLADPADYGGSPIGGGRALLDGMRDVIENAGQWSRDRWTQALPVTLGALTLRQLADIGQTHLPGLAGYIAEQQRMDTRRNEMVDESGVFASDQWERWARKRENRAAAEDVATLMHDSTRAQEDPSEAHEVLKVSVQLGPGDLFWREREARPEVVRELMQKAREMARSGQREDRGLAPYYMAAARKVKSALRAEQKRVAARPKLVEQWNALPAEAQAIYRQARDMYRKRSNEMMEALIARVNESGALDEGDRRQLAAQIRQEFEQTTDEKGNPRIGPYFPLQRFGRFYLFARRFPTGEQRTFTRMDGTAFASEAAARSALGSRADLRQVAARPVELEDGSGWVLEELGEPGFWMFESVPERRRGEAQLQAQGWNVVRKGLTQQAHKEVGEVSEGFIADAVAKLKDRGAEDEADMLYQMYLQTLHQMSARKHFIHRKGTEGFSNDALRAFGWNMTRLAHQIAKLEHVPRMERLLREIEEQKKADAAERSDHDSTVADAYYQELEKRHQWIVNPDNAAWTNFTSGLGFAWYLGVTPGAALVNLTQTPIVALPTLAADYGWKASAGALSQAFLDVGRGFKPGVVVGFLTGRPLPSQAANLSAEEQAAFEAWERSGVRDRTRAHNLAGIGDTDAFWNGPRFNRAMAVISSLFHGAEVVNRDTTLLAGYRLARAKGMGHEAAVSAAEQATWESHFDYANANRARFMQSNAAKALLMFRSYSQHVTYFMWRNLYQWTKGESAEVRREARTRFLGVLGMTGLFAGTLGLPMLGAVFAAANMAAAAFGDDDEPFDAEAEFRAWLHRTFPGGVSDVLDRGAANWLTGADWSSRVSLRELWYRSPDRDLDGAGTYQHVVEQLLGPLGGIGSAPFTAADLVADGHWARAAEAVAPKFLKDALKAGRYAAEGVQSKRGDPIVSREELGGYGAVLKALGLNPDLVSVRYDANNAVKRYEGRVLERRSRLMSAYALALMHQDPEAQANLLPKIRAFNAAQPTIPITRRSIQTSVRNRERYSARAEQGIAINPRLERFRDVGAFAE